MSDTSKAISSTLIYSISSFAPFQAPDRTGTQVEQDCSKPVCTIEVSVGITAAVGPVQRIPYMYVIDSIEGMMSAHAMTGLSETASGTLLATRINAIPGSHQLTLIAQGSQQPLVVQPITTIEVGEQQTRVTNHAASLELPALTRALLVGLAGMITLLGIVLLFSTFRPIAGREQAFSRRISELRRITTEHASINSQEVKRAVEDVASAVDTSVFVFRKRAIEIGGRRIADALVDDATLSARKAGGA